MKPCILNMKLEINMRASLRSGLAPVVVLRKWPFLGSGAGAPAGCGAEPREEILSDL